MAIRGGRGGGPGGGGRSHFSSSRSSGGRSHMSSSSRMGGGPRHSSHIGLGHRHHGGGIHIGFFSSGHMSAGSAMIVFGVFFIFITIMLGIGIGVTNGSLDTIQQSYNNYQSMIEMAMENEDYVRYATVTGKYQSTNDRWYIEYTLDEGPGYEYDSFAIYTKEEVNQFKVGDQIKIAVEDARVDLFTATIPFDYYNSDIKDDAEYIQFSKSRNLLIGIACATAGVAILLIFFGIKKSKKSKEEIGDSTQTTQASTTINTTKTCRYCGGKTSASESRCPQCGASLQD